VNRTSTFRFGVFRAKRIRMWKEKKKAAKEGIEKRSRKETPHVILGKMKGNTAPLFDP